MQCHNTVFGSKRSAICTQAVYFLHSTMASVVPGTDWCQRYLPCYLFSVSNSGLLFFHVGPPGRTAAYWFTQYRTSDVAEIWVDTFFVRGVHPVELFWISSTVKMETKHPVEGYFGSEFRAICSHCGVMAAWSCKTWNFVEKFLRLFGKTTPTVKFSKLCTESFHRLTDRRCCVQISRNVADGKSAKSCVIYQTKIQNFAARLSIAPKICRGQPPTMYSECSRFHPNRFTFDGVRDERVNTAKLPLKVNPIFGWSLASSRVKKVGLTRAWWSYLDKRREQIADRRTNGRTGHSEAVYHSRCVRCGWIC